MVTNAQYPEQIRDLKPITQLYISIDAPNKELMKEIDKPLFPDFWERFNQSLDYLAAKKERTCVRLTMIKGINDSYLDKYAELIKKSDTDFIEVKAYMHIGKSQHRLSKKNMPLHEEVVVFSKELEKHLENYEIVSEHIPSRVVMFAKKKFKQDGVWKTWIDFQKFNELIQSDGELSFEKYCRETPEIGLSGKGTLDSMPAERRAKYEEMLGKDFFVDEDTEEIDFYRD